MMTFTLLFLTGLFAGTVDAIAGGGGLISLPVLLSLGMPPHIAFGTNKLQGTIGTFIATRRYYCHGLISLAHIYQGIIFGIVGSIFGAVTSQIMSSEILCMIIPILLCIILLYTLFSPRLGLKDQKPRMHENWFFLIFGLSLGFYDGFFGPATGSFWVFLLTVLLGYNLIKATAYTKVFNFNSSVIATICFAFGGNIDYRIALCMAAGSLLGGRIGAALAIKKGAQVIRPIFLFVVSATIITLIYRNYSSADAIRLFNQHSFVLNMIIAITLLLSIVFIYIKKNKNRISDEL